MSVLTTSHSTGGPGSCAKAGERNKRHTEKWHTEAYREIKGTQIGKKERRLPITDGMTVHLRKSQGIY